MTASTLFPDQSMSAKPQPVVLHRQVILDFEGGTSYFTIVISSDTCKKDTLQELINFAQMIAAREVMGSTRSALEKCASALILGKERVYSGESHRELSCHGVNIVVDCDCTFEDEAAGSKMSDIQEALNGVARTVAESLGEELDALSVEVPKMPWFLGAPPTLNPECWRQFSDLYSALCTACHEPSCPDSKTPLDALLDLSPEQWVQDGLSQETADAIRADQYVCVLLRLKDSGIDVRDHINK